MKRFFLLVLLLLNCGSTYATTLRVATRAVPPFVLVQDGKFSGFSIDLWQEIARRLGVGTQFVAMPDIDGVMQAVGSGKADLGISAISITAEREAKFEFSQPMLEAGLQIMTPVVKRRIDVVTAAMEGIFNAAMLPLLLAVTLGTLVPAHLVWFWERRHPQGMLQHREYFPGIFEACWWAAATLATQADQMPRALLARLVAIIWMFSAAIFIAYFTASVTSSLTLQQLHGNISSPADLPGKRVLSLAGSTSATFLEEHGVTPRVYETLEEAADALARGEADAMVYDAPALMYYAAHDGQGKVQLVGQVFRKENYGILFQDGSPLRKAVDGALLKMREDGTFDLLATRWFGAR